MEEVEIRVKGHIDMEWSKWLGGLSIVHTNSGESVLTGSVRDQAAMYGVLEKIYGMGLRLVAVSCGDKPVKIKEG